MAISWAILRAFLAVVGVSFASLAWSEFVFYNEDTATALVAAYDASFVSAAFYVGDVAIFYLVPSAFLVGLVGLFV